MGNEEFSFAKRFNPHISANKPNKTTTYGQDWKNLNAEKRLQQLTDSDNARWSFFERFDTYSWYRGF
jgi:hypothetical protein